MWLVWKHTRQGKSGQDAFASLALPLLCICRPLVWLGLPCCVALCALAGQIELPSVQAPLFAKHTLFLCVTFPFLVTACIYDVAKETKKKTWSAES